MKSPENVILINEISKLKTKEELWNPYAWYQYMRENHPVFYDTEQDVWNVFLYEHAKRVLFDHQLFSNKKERSFIPISKIMDNRSNVNFCDPPQHRNRRALLAKAFTPRSLESWEPRIQAIVDELLIEMEGQSAVDIIQKLAIPLPVIVIAELLGVPSKDRAMIKSWSDILFFPYEKETYSDIVTKKEEAMKEFYDCLYPIVLEKRKHPADDIISDLTKAELEGERLTDEEVVISAIGLLGAGNETTTTLISNIFYSMLFDKPGVYQELRADFSLVPKLIEEVLRFRFPSTNDRKVVQDTTVFGHEMKQGQMVMVWTGAANRDESQFTNAEEFYIHRLENQSHLAFGSGPHFCLGAPLARMEARIALTSFVKRFANIRQVEGFDVIHHLTDSAMGQALKSLPIVIDHNRL
ncbi:cytochrome P450 [Bacillus pseudomycoides]|uniref:Cytochrome P450 n=1 Tax=Bacillus pseudomycoides TaxID=64104 RepID=A0ABD6T9K9_9BACI|nr:cytochrome P450 [Bacillus pseudomycoides]MBD5797365.1 cytochrome P450 [Bacillus pseudomycoides]MED1477422.1 cytochrome P450 [Bacillus pseudomycoides]PEO88840.1 cytochrome P450 [Bacillus pseudomycoides]PEP71724.1 cytochrome P450 [Bacillus pseudomycoides]PGF06433.1 cytochrome P450 [Bacillus pseudomycoides]